MNCRIQDVTIRTPPVFVPLLDRSARYLGCFGGRGSGKSHFMAELMVERALAEPGLRAVCIREVQKSLAQSSKRLIEDKLEAFGLGKLHGFEVLHDRIITPGQGNILFMGMADQSAENIKSLENIKIAWLEEAQVISARSLELLRPTIRAPGSQIWCSWNARRKTDPVDALLRGPNKPTGAVVVQANWRDNPQFPAVLEQERQDCKRIDPDQYGHIWEGEYIQLMAGAYYAAAITEARAEGRFVERLPIDPVLPIKIAVDIGGTGARSDAFTMWAFQNVGREIRILNYYEAVGQPLAAHAEWLRLNRYTQNRTQLYLPHDGVQSDKVFKVSYESSLRELGYDVTVIKNQGAGAALARIAVGRRMFASCWFDSKTEPGVDAVGWYHEKRDEVRQIGLGPDHDWSSHGADSFGLAMIVSDEAFSNGNWTRDTFTGKRNGNDDAGSYSRGRTQRGG
jgi:phage terminase large subunit